MTAAYAAGFQPQYDFIIILTSDKIFHIALDGNARESALLGKFY